VAPFRLGTLVTRAGLRPPALLAHMAATVGQVAGGTLIVGLGMGDAANRTENQAFGLPYHDDPLKRAAELVRSAAALRGVELPCNPQPGGGSQPGGDPAAGGAVAEVWVGGGSHRARGLAGRLAEAWNGWGLTPEELAAGLVEVRRAAEEAGRDPSRVTATWGGQVLVGEDAAEARALLARWGAKRPAEDVGRTVAGDPAAVVARLAELGGAGASWCVIAPVGGPAAAMRALLAEAASLTPRVAPERADG
jgi:alkanesulfonate monooxygenase SsuD/methylene tetrahydromethanopterin reductase-like flavin-dependent oxidoreductase (luciferase family)